MSQYRTLNQTVLAKVESTPGTDAAPVVGTNAVLVENPQSTPTLETIETNEVTGELDARGRLPAGGFRPMSFDVYLKGSGTGGTAPEYHALLKGAAIAETLTAVAVTGTATAGGANSITLAAGASAVNNAYRGMVITITDGTGAGQWAAIVSYDGTTKVATVTPAWASLPGGVVPDATSDYEIPANALYGKTSVAPNLTLYRYRHRSDGGLSKLDKLIGSAGTGTINFTAGNPGRMSLNYQGQLTAPADVTAPGAATYQDARAAPFLDALVYLNDDRVALGTLEFDLGNEVQQTTDPNEEFGRGIAGITRRQSRGTLNLPLALESDRNVFLSWRDQTPYHVWLRYGGVAGNRVSLLVPDIFFVGQAERDVNGFANEDIPYDAPSGFFLCLH